MLGKQLKILRENRKKSQQEVCNALNIEQSTLANYENGKRVPKIDILVKIAKYYDVSVDYLLGIEEVKSKEYMYCNDISNRIASIASRSKKNIDDIKPLLKTEILSGYCTNLDLFISDVYAIADFFGVTDEYILGGAEFEEQTYGKYLDYPEIHKFISTFIALNDDNKDIIIGEMKKLLKTQKYEDLVAERRSAK